MDRIKVRIILGLTFFVCKIFCMGESLPHRMIRKPAGCEYSVPAGFLSYL